MSEQSNNRARTKSAQLNRRRFLAYFAGIGLTPTLLPGILWAKVQEAETHRITPGILKEAEKLAGLDFTETERELMLEGVNEFLSKYEALRQVPLDNSVTPSLHFNPVLPGMTFDRNDASFQMTEAEAVPAPSNLEEVAFWPVTRLAHLIQSRKVTSTNLTKMYLERLKRYGAKLECVVTLTEKLAMEQAAKVDKEIAGGNYRGPLHGIPWGAKDLLAVRGYKTTWGAMPFKDQIIEVDAAVVERLEEAGAVLVAKLTLGALALGRCLVRRQDEEPMESGTRFQRFFRRTWFCNFRRSGGLCHRLGNLGLHRFAGHPLWGDGTAPDVRTGEPLRCDGPKLEHG